MRLIDADALLMQMMHKFHYELPDGCNNPLYGDVIDVIEDAPTIDAEPVRHGQWVETADGGYADAAMRCSACDFQFENWSGLFAYCPVCGAKMDALTFEEASRKLGQQAAETLKKLKEAGYA